MVTARQITNGRRFGNATLDADLEHLRAYFAFNENAGNFLNSAPFGDDGPMGRSGAVTYGASGVGGGGVSFADGIALSRRISGMLPGGGFSEFSINFWIEAPDATPASGKALFALSNASGVNPLFQLELDSGGNVNLYVDGAFRISGTTVLSDNTRYRITVRRALNAGTPTWYLYIDGVEEGTATGAANTFDCASVDYLYVGRAAAILAWPNNAIISGLSVWSKALSTSQIAALEGGGTPVVLKGAGL